MPNYTIPNQNSHSLRIQELESLSYDQSKLIKNTVLQIIKNNNPINIGKKPFTEYIEIKKSSTSLKDGGLITIADFFIGNVLGKYRSASGYML